MNKTQYLLCCLNEELAEVQQEIGKCLRFTCDHKPEIYPTTNIERVQLEMADVYAISMMLKQIGVNTGIVTPAPSQLTEAQLKRVLEKSARTEKLMLASIELGALNVAANGR